MHQWLCGGISYARSTMKPPERQVASQIIYARLPLFPIHHAAVLTSMEVAARWLMQMPCSTGRTQLR